MPITKIRKSVVDIPGTTGKDADELSVGNHTHSVSALDLIYYLSPTGDDVSGDGTVVSPWFSLNRAFEVLQNQRIEEDNTVTIQVDEGVYPALDPVSLDYDFSDRVIIEGFAPVIRNLTNVISYGGVSGAWNVEIEMDDNTGIFVDDWIELSNVESNAGNDDEKFITGIFQVDTVTISGVVFTCKNISTHAMITGAFTGEVAIHKSILEFTTGGLSLTKGIFNNINNVLLVGTGSSDAIFVKDTAQISCGPYVGCTKFYSGFRALNGGRIKATYSTATECGFGFMLQNNCHLSGNYLSATHSNLYIGGFVIDEGSFANCQNVISVGNQGAGIQMKNNSTFIGSNCVWDGNWSRGIRMISNCDYYSTNSWTRYNLGEGIRAEKNSSVRTGVIAKYNSHSGVRASSGTAMELMGSKAESNGYHGFEATYNSTMSFNSSAEANVNTQNGFYAQYNSTINAQSTSATTNNINYVSEKNSTINGISSVSNTPITAIDYSPSVNIEGNNGAFIIK